MSVLYSASSNAHNVDSSQVIVVAEHPCKLLFHRKCRYMAVCKETAVLAQSSTILNDLLFTS